jgi:hypothetical protein
MITLVLSAMIGASKQISPYLSGLSHRNDAERFQQLASHILLNTGTPSNWGADARDRAEQSRFG